MNKQPRTLVLIARLATVMAGGAYRMVNAASAATAPRGGVMEDLAGLAPGHALPSAAPMIAAADVVPIHRCHSSARTSWCSGAVSAITPIQTAGASGLFPEAGVGYSRPSTAVPDVGGSWNPWTDGGGANPLPLRVPPTPSRDVH
jgi:hypothetical protein